MKVNLKILIFDLGKSKLEFRLSKVEAKGEFEGVISILNVKGKFDTKLKEERHLEIIIA